MLGRRVVSMVIAAAAVTIIITVAAGRQDRSDSGISPDLEAAIRQVLMGHSCLKAADAEPLLRVSMGRAGFSDWSVLRGDGVRADGCVSAGVDPSEHRIVLIPTPRLEVRLAMRFVKDELYQRCLGKDEALELVASVLRGVGEASPRIRTDGPIVIPEASAKIVQRHADAGCFTYSGMTWTPTGEPVYLLGGNSLSRSEGSSPLLWKTRHLSGFTQ